jgi:hypothetical protein
MAGVATLSCQVHAKGHDILLKLVRYDGGKFSKTEQSRVTALLTQLQNM